MSEFRRLFRWWLRPFLVAKTLALCWLVLDVAMNHVSLLTLGPWVLLLPEILLPPSLIQHWMEPRSALLMLLTLGPLLVLSSILIAGTFTSIEFSGGLLWDRITGASSRPPPRLDSEE